MKMQCFDTCENNVVTYAFLTCCIMNFSEKYIKKIVLKQSLFLSWKALKQNGRKFFFYWWWNTVFISIEVCIEYKAEREYCGINWESVRNNYEQMQEKLIQQYPKNSTDGFPNSGNVEHTLTVKCIGGKLKTIRRNFTKALDTNNNFYPLKMFFFLFPLIK